MKKGFTLAEVLITLAVIGVVATLTLPNVIGNHQNKVLMTQLQKTINTVQNAVLKAMEDNAAERFDDLTQEMDARVNFLKNYFDTVNICHEAQYNKCLADSYTSFDKSSTSSATDVVTSFMSSDHVYCADITSGATICIGGSGAFGGAKKFIIDVNGVKGPNVAGKDLFSFYVQPNGKMRYNLNTEESHDDYMQLEASGQTCTTSTVGIGHDGNVCLPYIISHGWQFKY